MTTKKIILTAALAVAAVVTWGAMAAPDDGSGAPVLAADDIKGEYDIKDVPH
ncbi:hypothetical protein [Nonomuraea basaltis]|uniref:hypothetical protein n=1 Tax=Nonomuraea basaltis TaxID=2495887 RepID=UPI001486AEA5|nr:hypothetical protein [Nonomuraea basaltis]